MTAFADPHDVDVRAAKLPPGSFRRVIARTQLIAEAKSVEAEVEARMAKAAQEAVERDIARGVRWLIESPHKANRIIPHATNMSLSALTVAVARYLSNATDFNRRMSLLQLRAALPMAEFAEAWERMREEQLS